MYAFITWLFIVMKILNIKERFFPYSSLKVVTWRCQEWKFETLEAKRHALTLGAPRMNIFSFSMGSLGNGIKLCYCPSIVFKVR